MFSIFSQGLLLHRSIFLTLFLALPTKVGPLAHLSGIPCQNMHSLSKHVQNMNSTPFSATLGGAPFMHHMLYVNCYSKEGQAKSPMYSSAEFPHAFPGTLCPRPASLTQSVICKSNQKVSPVKEEELHSGRCGRTSIVLWDICGLPFSSLGTINRNTRIIESSSFTPMLIDVVLVQEWSACYDNASMGSVWFTTVIICKPKL